MVNHTVETLQKLGLAENEALLYSLMVKYPRSTVQQLQTRTPFPRTMLYHVLDQLIKKNLVSTTKDSWRTTYIAENPARLYDILAQRQQEFHEQTQTVRELIPELKQAYLLAGSRPDVRVLDGIKGYGKALEDILATRPSTVYRYRPETTQKRSGIETREAFEGKRIRKKIVAHELLFDSRSARTELSTRAYDDYTQFRVITAQLQPFQADLTLYSGKLLYITYSNSEPTATIIEDKNLFTMQQQLFALLWATGKDITINSTSQHL